MIMKRILFFLFALIAYGSVWSQTNIDLFSIDGVTIEPDGKATIYVATLDPGDEDLKGAQFDLYLPVGISIDEITEVDDETGEVFTYPDVSMYGTYNINNFDVSFEQKNNFVRFIIKHKQKTSVIKKSAKFLKIGIKASADYATAGDMATVCGSKSGNTVNPILISSDGINKFEQDPIDFRIILPLDEEKDYSAFGDFTGNVKVKRTIGAGKWNTICLPFEMDNTQVTTAFGAGVKIAEFTECKTYKKGDLVTGLGLHFTSMTTPAIVANRPYLIQVNEAVTSFVVNKTTFIDPTEDNPPSVTVTGGTFVGNYKYIKNLGEDHPVLFLSNNQFYTAIGKTKLKSFRGYFDLDDLAQYRTDKNAAANINFFVDDEQATEIVGVTTGQGTPDAVYDLQGRQIKVDGDLNSLQKGVYIINGQKVTVK